MPVCIGRESLAVAYGAAERGSGRESSDDELRKKNGGSWSAKEAAWLRTALFDFSNQFSALLLSPELPLPASGLKLEGESLASPDERSSRPPLLDEDWLRLFAGARSLDDACSKETDAWAGRRRGCEGTPVVPCARGRVLAEFEFAVPNAMLMYSGQG